MSCTVHRISTGCTLQSEFLNWVIQLLVRLHGRERKHHLLCHGLLEHLQVHTAALRCVIHLYLGARTKGYGT